MAGNGRMKMTANELADLLDFDAKTLNWKAFADAATMLRQQQAEIERLTMLCDCMTTESNRKGNEIEALKRHRNRLETLAEQMLQGDGND